MMDVIAAERRALADVLGGLSTAQWHAPSLCAGWTVAHVAAHLTMPFRISADEFASGLQQAGGQFTEFSDAVADRDSRLPQADLVAVLRDNAENPWSPPGGGLAGALSHDVIHGLDITWPLGIDRQAADPAMITVLDLTVSPGDRTLFGFPLDVSNCGPATWTGRSATAPPCTGGAVTCCRCSPGGRSPASVFSGAGTQRLGARTR